MNVKRFWCSNWWGGNNEQIIEVFNVNCVEAKEEVVEEEREIAVIIYAYAKSYITEIWSFLLLLLSLSLKKKKMKQKKTKFWFQKFYKIVIHSFSIFPVFISSFFFFCLEFEIGKKWGRSNAAVVTVDNWNFQVVWD